eukprot:scaffold34639_cov206-Amphora_coffeaeformis.AAC.14
MKNQQTTNRAPGSGDAASSARNSPTSSFDSSQAPEEELLFGIIPADVQQYALDTFQQVQDFCQETQQNFVLDRKAITATIFIVLASIVVGCMFAVLGVGGLVLVTCPLWAPIALLSSPLWIPLTVLSSPIWMTASVTVLAC